MRRIYFLPTIALVFIFSCGSNSGIEEGILASVGENSLRSSDVASIVPKGMSAKDSILFVKNYTTVWVKEQLLLQKAEENLGSDLKDFEKQLQDYRKSLLIYTYENELAKSMTDTTVSEKEIGNYYQQQKENFRLRDNILRVNYIIVSTKNGDLNKIKKLLNSSLEKDKNELNTFCVNSAYKCFLEDSVWLSSSDLSRDIPQIESEDLYNRGNRLLELKDSSLTYLIMVKQVSKIGDISPLEFVKDNIKSVILNNRKKAYISEMRENIFKEAEEKKTFEIYIK